MDYNKTDPKSIEAFAKKLVGKTLREAVGTGCVVFQRPKKGNKGQFGQAIEECYFGIRPGSSKLPDFPEAGVELKTLPLKKTSRGYRAKERLVLNIINPFDVAEESWKDSSFLSKNKLLLIVGYLPEKGKSLLSHRIAFVRLWQIPEDDLPVIKNDWRIVRDKIRAGQAHELSEGDTFYIGACTKGSTAAKSFRDQPFSDTKAKQRAFSYKVSYVNNAVIHRTPSDTERIVTALEGKRTVSIESVVAEKLGSYIGKTDEQVRKMLGAPQSGSKSRHANLVKQMLGIKKDKIAEFEMGDIQTKTIRLQQNGNPKESISFPYFDYRELVNETWEESVLREVFEKRFLFVVWQFGKDKKLYFRGAKFWTMSQETLDGEVKRVWKETIRRINSGEYDKLPAISESSVCHVRPHGRDSKDTILGPDGEQYGKKCFWLNAGYVAIQIMGIDSK